jgi:hypothetical protein
VSGFTKTSRNPSIVRAFMVHRRGDSNDGIVELRWKPEPDLSQDWLGVDGTTQSDGFVVLNSQASAAPELAPQGTSLKPKVGKFLAKEHLQRYLEAEGVSLSGFSCLRVTLLVLFGAH